MIRKILLGTLFFLFFFVSSNLITKNVFADVPKCTLEPSTINITNKDSSATITVKNDSGNMAPEHPYKIQVSGGKACWFTSGPAGYCPYVSTTLKNGVLSGKINFNGTITPGEYLANGQYSISVIDEKTNQNVCSTSFQVGTPDASSTGTCSIVFVNRENCPTGDSPGCFKPSDAISIRLTGDPKKDANPDPTKRDPNELFHALVKDTKTNRNYWEGCITRGNLLKEQGFSFGYLTTGSYSVEVDDSCGGILVWSPNYACSANFDIDPNGGGINGEGNVQNPIPTTPCSNGGNQNGACTMVDTGFGFSIGTNPASLLQSVFGIILSVSGGIAILLIIFSGYRMLISRGDPEAIKGAREQLTAAIVGLLFIIFALVILQVIGYDILRIPGFGGSSTQTFNAGGGRYKQ